MIEANFYKKENKIVKFDIKNHSEHMICAGVSALAVNAVNSIEEFTQDKFSVDMDIEGEIIFELEDLPGRKAMLLLDSLLLGLIYIEKEFPEEMTISVKEEL